MSGPPEGRLPPIADGTGALAVDPLPQALILTAIVIGFGVISYLVVLLYRLFLDHGTTSAAELFREQGKEDE
jgi:multicomponent Na+:H+ antiporter subunit C